MVVKRWLVVGVVLVDTVCVFGCSMSMSAFGFPAGGAGGFTSTSSSTRIVNGRRIVTKK